MAERYTRLFLLPETDLYETGAPLLLCAGALLKDTQTGRMIAQLKFRNIGEKPITAVKVSVRAFDAFGAEVEGVPEYQYLDLSASRDCEFGQKTPIVLPNTETRSFSCACKSVIFADGSVWNAQTEDWNPLTKQESLEARFGNLAAQYRRDTHHASAKYAVAEDRDLWRCVCGTINREEETACHVCNSDREALKAAEDPKLLKEHDEAYQKRLAEQAEAARLEKERKAEEARSAAEQKRKATKKRGKIIAIVSLISLVCIAFVIVLTSVIIPNQKYYDAVELYNAGKYEEAIAAFTALNGYRDSAELILKSRYSIAAELYNDGKYEEAKTAFEALGGYKDCESQVDKCISAIYDPQYYAARSLYDVGQYEEAIAAFKDLNGYRDSQKQIEACKSAIYGTGEALYSAGQFEEALKTFESLGYFLDSQDKVKECETAIEREDLKKSLSKVSVGSTIVFGKDIEWLVLEKKGNKLLVITKDVLDDWRKFNDKAYSSCSWYGCQLKKWLNGSFYKDAFSDAERSMITETRVVYSHEFKEHHTDDYIFLLSIAEAEKYFKTDTERRCGKEWWLRDTVDKKAAYVTSAGYSTTSNGSLHFYDEITDWKYVRPALWIDVG